LRLRLLGPRRTWWTGLRLRLHLSGHCTAKATLDPDDRAHRAECGLQVFKSRFVLAPELLDVPFELPLHGADLLLKQIGTVLQVPTDVTHVMIPQPFNVTLANG
jgi:hypothetical protein